MDTADRIDLTCRDMSLSLLRYQEMDSISASTTYILSYILSAQSTTSLESFTGATRSNEFKRVIRGFFANKAGNAKKEVCMALGCWE